MKPERLIWLLPAILMLISAAVTGLAELQKRRRPPQKSAKPERSFRGHEQPTPTRINLTTGDKIEREEAMDNNNNNNNNNEPPLAPRPPATP